MDVTLTKFQEDTLSKEARLRGLTLEEFVNQYIESWALSVYKTSQERDRQEISAALLNVDDNTKRTVRGLLGL